MIVLAASKPDGLLAEMTIDLDTRAAIRHPDLVRVAQAVIDAEDHDEADWIEWKSDLQLSTKQGCFPIARTILGMANRMPEVASLVCEGLGYIVVGASPGKVVGVASVDPADLDQILEPWLGGVEGPRYMATYVVADGKKVLIVVVEAPRRGDRIYTLRKEFDGGRDGDIFVRKPGRTDRANSADVKALMERAAARTIAAPDLEVSLVGDIPLSWLDTTTIGRIVATWVAERRGSMESAARSEERERNSEWTPRPKDRNFDAAASAMAELARHQEQLARVARDMARMASVAGLADVPDNRTLDEYLAEVEAWGERALSAGPAVLLDRYLRTGHGLVAVRVHNPSGQYLPKVKVEVHFEWDQASSPELEYVDQRLPAEPRPYGKPSPSALAQSLSFSPSLYRSLIPEIDPTPTAARSWTEKGSVKIVFDVGDLRQEGTETSDTHHLLLPARPPGGILQGTWKATVPEVHGVIRGRLDVPIDEDSVDLRGLLDSDPVDDDT